MRLGGQQRPGGSDGDGILNVTGTTQDFKHTCDMVTFYRAGGIGALGEHGSNLDRSWCRGITVDCAGAEEEVLLRAGVKRRGQRIGSNREKWRMYFQKILF